MDAKTLARFRKTLLEEKQRILNNSKNALKNELVLSPDDLPDETDLAASEISQNLVFKLRDRERQLLAKVLGHWYNLLRQGRPIQRKQQ